MIIDKLAWILIRDGKLLTVRSKGKSLFYLPGGKREAGESDEQALLREIKEELDVDLIPETIKYIGTFEAQADGKSEGVTVKLTCY
ncbi:NUDIX hydrolase, partial [Plesiomonas shigelloides]